MTGEKPQRDYRWDVGHGSDELFSDTTKLPRSEHVIGRNATVFTGTARTPAGNHEEGDRSIREKASHGVAEATLQRNRRV